MEGVSRFIKMSRGAERAMSPSTGAFDPGLFVLLKEQKTDGRSMPKTKGRLDFQLNIFYYLNK